MEQTDYSLYGLVERDYDAVEHVEEIAPSFDDDYAREEILESIDYK